MAYLLAMGNDMTDSEPEALRLADALAKDAAVTWGDVEKAAEMLRRLYEENQALRDRLAQPEPSHLQFSGSMHVVFKCERCLAQSELKREWVGLTDEERMEIRTQSVRNMGENCQETLCKAIEAKLKEKNS